MAGNAADTANQTGPVPLPRDTVLYLPGNDLDSVAAVNVPVDFETRRLQNPTGALFKSMVVPGWGQVGNKRYTKAVIFAGLQAWFVGSAIHYGNQAADFRSKFTDASSVDEKNEWYSLYNDRRDERNKFTWFAVLVTFVGMFDAYVDAHLSAYPSTEMQRQSGFGSSTISPDVTGIAVHWSF